MTIRHFTIFKEVYLQQNMTRAAQNLYLTQPSVSQAIKELETHYGVLLFERLGRKLYPTKEGEILYQNCSQILSYYQHLEDTLSMQAETSLRIGVNYTVGLSMIHELLDSFETIHPKIKVQVFVNRASIIKEMLTINELDLSVIEASKNDPELIYQDFLHDHIVVVCSNRHPYAKKEITMEQLSHEPLLCREPGVGSRELFLQEMQKAGFQITPLWESISITALINACIHNRGIAILPYESVKKHLENQTLSPIQVKGLNLDRQLAVTYHKNKYLSKAALDFLSICEAYSIEKNTSL